MTSLPDPVATDLKSQLDSRPMSSFQVLMVTLCVLLNLNDGIDVLVVSFTGSEIVREWNLSKGELGYVFSAGLTGMTAGCFLLAPLGDRIGRRKLFLISLSLITLGMLLVALISDYWQLLALRLLTGIGIGGILPNLAAVASEFSNEKRRDFNVGLVQAGWPIGAILAGFFVAWAVPLFGWRSAYLAAGLVSGFMLVIVGLFMPESIAFLTERQPRHALPQLNAILMRLKLPSLNALPVQAQERLDSSVATLFTPGYRTSTIRLWIGIFFGFLTLYTLMSWVPTLAKDGGMPFELATYIGSALNVGAFVGSASIGILAARLGLRQFVALFMATAFCVMISYGNLSMTYGLMFAMTFFIGFFVQGGFNAFYPIAARVYPAAIRTTGLGLAMGVGRFGAILGPALFGLLSDQGMSRSLLFSLFSLPLLVAGVMAFTIPQKALE